MASDVNGDGAGWSSVAVIGTAAAGGVLGGAAVAYVFGKVWLGRLVKQITADERTVAPAADPAPVEITPASIAAIVDGVAGRFPAPAPAPVDVSEDSLTAIADRVVEGFRGQAQAGDAAAAVEVSDDSLAAIVAAVTGGIRGLAPVDDAAVVDDAAGADGAVVVAGADDADDADDAAAAAAAAAAGAAGADDAAAAAAARAASRYYRTIDAISAKATACFNYLCSTRVAQGISNRVITPISASWSDFSDRKKKAVKGIVAIFAIAIAAVGFRKRAAIAASLTGRVSFGMPSMPSWLKNRIPALRS